MADVRVRTGVRGRGEKEREREERQKERKDLREAGREVLQFPACCCVRKEMRCTNAYTCTQLVEGKVDIESNTFCVSSSESKVMYQQSFSANTQVEKFGQWSLENSPLICCRSATPQCNSQVAITSVAQMATKHVELTTPHHMVCVYGTCLVWKGGGGP